MYTLPLSTLLMASKSQLKKKKKLRNNVILVQYLFILLATSIYLFSINGKTKQNKTYNNNETRQLDGELIFN